MPDEFGKPAPPPEIEPALNAFRLMEGRIDWQALPAVFEMIGIKDFEEAIAALEQIRTEVRALPPD